MPWFATLPIAGDPSAPAMVSRFSGAALLGFPQGYLHPADETRGQVVHHRPDGGHRGDQDDVQRAEQGGVAEDPRSREPGLRVHSGRILAGGDAVHEMLDRVEDAEPRQRAVEHADRHEQDHEGDQRDHEAELHHRPRLDPRDGQVRLPGRPLLDWAFWAFCWPFAAEPPLDGPPRGGPSVTGPRCRCSPVAGLAAGAAGGTSWTWRTWWAWPGNWAWPVPGSSRSGPSAGRRGPGDDGEFGGGSGISQAKAAGGTEEASGENLLPGLRPSGAGAGSQNRTKEDFSDVVEIGLDETSRKKGHEYITLVADIKDSKVIFACEGKDSSTITSFSEDLQNHNGNPNNIKSVCCDMSPSYISGISKELPNAEITFDKFHVMKAMNEGVNEVRIQEQKK